MEVKHMVEDEIIAEVHKVRDELAARFSYDTARIYKYIKAQEAASGNKFARLPRKSKPKVAKSRR